MLVKYIGGSRVAKRFSGHNLTPVRTRVANGQENWPILRLGFSKDFVAPRLPVYGLLGMQFEIEAGLLMQGVLHDKSAVSCLAWLL